MSLYKKTLLTLVLALALSACTAKAPRGPGPMSPAEVARVQSAGRVTLFDLNAPTEAPAPDLSMTEGTPWPNAPQVVLLAWADTLIPEARVAVKDPSTPKAVREVARRTILFPAAATKLDAPAMKVVEELADLYRQDQVARLNLTGHASAQEGGTKGADLKLSLTRAFAVAQALMERGVPLSTMVVSGRGTAMGFTTPDAARRVDVDIMWK